MKNFQTNLLILLALALCGLCVFQWRIQTVQRHEITTMNGLLYQNNLAIQEATNSVAVRDHQIQQMDASLAELKAGATTNEQLVIDQKASLTRLQFSNRQLTNEITQYKTALDTLEARLKAAYGDLQKQNDALTNLVAQRDEWVAKYNQEVKDRNDVVAKYNELANRMRSPSGNPDNK
jgi:chromosome segregation ATPase